ncbi:MAG: aminopeptidase P family protein [Chloroflexi bacterium]|nr:aminopeptidase P family protein [Chloroflexota bacterium]
MERRLAKLDAALAAQRCDAYLSAVPADARYFTGCEPGGATLWYRPGRRPTLVIHRFDADHAADTAPGCQIISFYDVDERPGEKIQALIAADSPRRIAWDGVSPALAELLRGVGRQVEAIAAPRLTPVIQRRKEPEELALLRQAVAIADRAMAAAMREIRVGARELDAAAALEAEARRLGCTGAIGPTHCKGGPRSAYLGAPVSARQFEPGDLGYVDLAIFYQGYFGDLTRAFAIGELSPERRHILETVDAVQQYARSLVKPGAAARDIFAQTRRALAEAGYPGSPPHHVGHGVGLGGGCLPMLVLTSDDVIEEGDVLTVEPGVYVRGVGGVRIEDVVLVKATGIEVLSQHPRVTWIPAS